MSALGVTATVAGCGEPMSTSFGNSATDGTMVTTATMTGGSGSGGEDTTTTVVLLESVVPVASPVVPRSSSRR